MELPENKKSFLNERAITWSKKLMKNSGHML